MMIFREFMEDYSRAQLNAFIDDMFKEMIGEPVHKPQGFVRLTRPDYIDRTKQLIGSDWINWMISYTRKKFANVPFNERDLEDNLQQALINVVAWFKTNYDENKHGIPPMSFGKGIILRLKGIIIGKLRKKETKLSFSNLDNEQEKYLFYRTQDNPRKNIEYNEMINLLDSMIEAKANAIVNKPRRSQIERDASNRKAVFLRDYWEAKKQNIGNTIQSYATTTTDFNYFQQRWSEMSGKQINKRIVAEIFSIFNEILMEFANKYDMVDAIQRFIKGKKRLQSIRKFI